MKISAKQEQAAAAAGNGSAAQQPPPAPKKRRAPKRKKADAVSGDVAPATEKRATAPRLDDEAIRLRAYFIAEERMRLGLPGNADSDWLEARRRLLAEGAQL